MKLLFIYNADSGALSTMLDIAHKIVSPSTYQCALCSITHGTFTENRQWKAFRETSRHELIFLHKDEYERQYKYNTEYPVIIDITDNPRILMSRSELTQISTVEELILKIEALN